MQEQIIQQFIEEMIQEAGLNGMSEKFKEDYIKKIRQEIDQRLGRAMVLVLKEDDLKAFNELIKKPDLKSEQILQFFNEHIANFPEFLEKELTKFKEEFIQQAKDLEKIQQSEKRGADSV